MSNELEKPTMKTLWQLHIKTLCFGIFFLFATSSKEQGIADPKAIMLRKFYTNYMSAFSMNDINEAEKVMNRLRKENLTQKAHRLYKEIGEKTDADPIIKGQDSDVKWIKTLRFKTDLNNPNVYYVTYSSPVLNRNMQEHQQITKIKLLLVKEDGRYKIDNFLN